MPLTIDSIVKITDALKKHMESNLPFINYEIDALIENDNKTVKRIEQLLDTLSDYMQLGVGESEFKKLNAYYASLNKENAAFYNKLHQEIMGD